MCESLCATGATVSTGCVEETSGRHSATFTEGTVDPAEAALRVRHVDEALADQSSCDL